MPAEMLAASSIVVEGKRFTSTGMGAVYKGVLALDASTTPRRLDMKFDAGPEKGNTNPGIYEIEGDTWKLCLSTRGGKRPASFATIPGSGFALETLTRGEASTAPKKKRSGKASPATPRDPRPTAFEGEWRMLSGVMDGRPMEKSLVKWVKRVTRGSLTTVYAGPQVMMQFEFTADAAKTPGEIEYLNTAGANKGKVQHGIYKFEGDVLRVCVGAPGDARPDGFQSASGDRRTLTVWRRAGQGSTR